MLKENWLNLQLFAEGTGEGGEEAASGENATVAAEQRLRELGVPEDKIRKRASKVASTNHTQTAKTEPVVKKSEETNVVSAPTENNPSEETKTNATARMSWDEIMEDPEYNKQMQAVVQSRLKSAKSAQDALTKLTPALEVLARKHNLDPTNMDYDALAQAVSNDRDYYEDKALEMGVPVETAMKIDQQEREKAREAKTLQEQSFQQHIMKLEQQGEALKKVFPSFDLRAELKNPVFARMTAPGVGLSVEDAYYAVHRNEIQIASMQAAAQKTAQKISNAIQSGSRRPDEAGISSQAPSETTFNYRNASKDQRDALKRRIRAAAAEGKKLYPGQ